MRRNAALLGVRAEAGRRFPGGTAASRLIVVGMADCQVSEDPAATLITYALGSCIAVSIYDPASRSGGLLHIILPESRINPAKAERNPYLFADTGLPRLLAWFAGRSGGDRLVVHLAGGAQVLDPAGVFNIGKRNHAVMRKLLWREGVLVASEAVGGTVSRTLWLELASGRVFVREAGCRQFEMGSWGHKE